MASDFWRWNRIANCFAVSLYRCSEATYLLLSLALLQVGAGCGPSLVTSQVPLPGEGASELATAAVLVLDHDFGVVAPKSKLSHRFTVSNDSQVTWNISRINTTCACTVPFVSRDFVEPNASEEFEVTLSVGEVVTNHNREIQVEFKEPEAPLLRLVVRAQTRVPVTIFPDRLDLGTLSPGQELERSFEIHNFDAQDWADLAVTCEAPWCRLESHLVADSEAKPKPRQVWRVNALFDMSGLSDSSHETEVRALPVGITRAEKIASSLPVTLRIAPALEAQPRQLFFGEVPAGTSARKKVQIVFRPEAVPENERAISLVNTAPEQVSLRWTRQTGRVWELEAAFEATGGSGFAGGAVELRSLESQQLLLAIPLQARVVRP